MNLTKATGHYSIRVQIIRQYDSMTQLLQHFPRTQDAFFSLGRVASGGGGGLSEGKQHFSFIKDPRQYRSRPLTLLSSDGKKLLNLWYIPHFSEVLSLFCDLRLEDCLRALSCALVRHDGYIVSSDYPTHMCSKGKAMSLCLCACLSVCLSVCLLAKKTLKNASSRVTKAFTDVIVEKQSA